MTDTLKINDSLLVGQELTSNNGQYRLLMQDDGNLVGYPVGSAQAWWASGTDRVPWDFVTKPVRATFQGDGNFVLYTQADIPVWATGTNNKGGTRLILQDDRHIVLYRDDNTPVWGSNTVLRTPDRQVNKPEVRGDTGWIDLGWAHRGRALGTLYRNGGLALDIELKNDAWFYGYSAALFAVPVDAGGNAIWVSSRVNCPTICGVMDPGCAANLRHNHFEALPAEVGKHAERLDIYLANVPRYTDLDALRQRFVDAVKGAGQIAAEIIAIVGTLA